MDSLVRDFPADIILVFISLLVIVVILIFTLKGFWEGMRVSVNYILLVYVSFLISYTLLMRSAMPNREFDFRPFWSYAVYFRGENPYLMPENMMNVAVFVPIGFLLEMVYRSMNWQKALLIGLVLSLFIEVMQFIFKRGFAEFDDVFHNTLGCMIGYGMFVLIKRSREWILQR